jgi:hypothetical protein
MDLRDRLASLWQQSPFRSAIHLNEAERAELRAIGRVAAADRSRPLIAARLGPARPAREGRQTPWHGYLTFPAQHATATCCRGCLAKHHGIAAGQPLSAADLDYIITCLDHYWAAELTERRPCECPRCRPSRRARPRAANPSLSFEEPTEPRRPQRGNGSQETGKPGNRDTGGSAADPTASLSSGFSDLPAADAPVTTGYNDLDLRRWKEYPEVETGSLWLFGARDRSGGHRLDYHGNFIPQIATQLFQRFSRKGEVVLDLFLGSGTSALEAVRLGRRCLGVELQPELAERVRAKLPGPVERGQVAIIEGDSANQETLGRVREQLAAWGEEGAHLLVLHPPYHNIIPFSDRPEDLSNAPSVADFLDRFRQIAGQGRELLAPGRFAALVIGDAYARGELVPLGFRCMEAMNQAGFRTRSIVVKNIEGNERGKGRDNNLWRYRALRGGFYLFKHEYVIIFQK